MVMRHAKSRAVSKVLAVCLLGFILGSCLGKSGKEPGTEEGPANHGAYQQSDIPMEADSLPLKWRLARVDARFGVSERDVEEAVRRGVALWEEAAGRKLFERVEMGGFPIELVYDERQRDLLERDRRNRAVEAAERALAAQRRTTEAAAKRFERASKELNRRVDVYDAKLNAYNELVRAINDSGGAEPEQEDRMLQRRLSLASDRAELEAAQEEVERLRIEANRMTDRYNRQVRAYNEKVNEQKRGAQPSARVKLGECKTLKTTYLGTTRTHVEGISVYAFQGLDHLASILAHELGHALGLGHVEDDGAVMSEVEDGRVTARRLKLKKSDRAELSRALKEFDNQ